LGCGWNANRPGADGYIAADQVAHSAPDGDSLLFASQSIFGIDPHVKKVMPVDPEKDFTPIAVMIDDSGATTLLRLDPRGLHRLGDDGVVLHLLLGERLRRSADAEEGDLLQFRRHIRGLQCLDHFRMQAA